MFLIFESAVLLSAVSRICVWRSVLQIAYCRGECSEAKYHVEQLSKIKECIVLLFCCAVVATLYMATIRVCLHDVSLMLERVEGAHGGEGGAPGQHTWHTQCSFLINRNTYSFT
jgi:hypothetical protein